MFTGIITGVGRIAAVHDLGSSSQHGKRLTIEAPAGYLDDVGLGRQHRAQWRLHDRHRARRRRSSRFTIDISAESLDKTAGLAEPGPDQPGKGPARPRPAGRPHRLRPRRRHRHASPASAQVGESWELRILAPRALGKYLAYKGSITVNGVSLTVNTIADPREGTEVSINLIPHTVQNTALAS